MFFVYNDNAQQFVKSKIKLKQMSNPKFYKEKGQKLKQYRGRVKLVHKFVEVPPSKWNCMRKENFKLFQKTTNEGLQQTWMSSYITVTLARWLVLVNSTGGYAVHQALNQLKARLIKQVDPNSHHWYYQAVEVSRFDPKRPAVRWVRSTTNIVCVRASWSVARRDMNRTALVVW